MSNTARIHEVEDLSARLDRAAAERPIRRSGDTMGQGGWQHESYLVKPPAPPSVWLTLLPFFVLLVVAVALTIGLLVLGAQS